MPKRFERLDHALGRIFYRAVWSLCAVVALVCGYLVWWHVSDWHPEYSWGPVILFGLATVAAGSAVPYCFSRKRTFGEALDAMEGGAGDVRRGRKP